MPPQLKSAAESSLQIPGLAQQTYRSAIRLLSMAAR